MPEEYPDPRMRITPHFTAGEPTRTTHTRLRHQNRREALDHIDAITATCNLAERVRSLCGDRPIIPHSGFRCKALNNALRGSSSRSQHMLGEALDFHVHGMPLEQVYEMIKASPIAADVGQCLLEGYVGSRPSWIHLSLGAPWRPAARSGQFFRLTVK